MDTVLSGTRFRVRKLKRILLQIWSLRISLKFCPVWRTACQNLLCPLGLGRCVNYAFADSLGVQRLPAIGVHHRGLGLLPSRHMIIRKAWTHRGTERIRKRSTEQGRHHSDSLRLAVFRFGTTQQTDIFRKEIVKACAVCMYLIFRMEATITNLRSSYSHLAQTGSPLGIQRCVCVPPLWLLPGAHTAPKSQR